MPTRPAHDEVVAALQDQEAAVMTRALRATAALVAVLALIAAGCGGDDDDASGDGAGLANPASVYCEERGGHVENEETAAGQRGICVLPDGTRTDEWELYRNRGSTTTQASATCSASDLGAEVGDEPNLPRAVAVMRADLADAAVRCDYDALAALADRNGAAVRFSWGDEKDPIAFWRAAEASGAKPPPLRALRLLLALPAARTDDGSGHVQYVWPAAFAVERPTDAQLQEIADTGLYDLATLQGWVEQGTNYLGYRVLITEAGDWTAFVAGD